MKTIQQLQQALVDDVRQALSELPDNAPIVITDPPKGVTADKALPCFPYAKALRQDPKKIAGELAEALGKQDFIDIAKAAGPYVNVTFSPQLFAQIVIDQVLKDEDKYGYSPDRGENVMVEYISPNTNKPLHLGHVRNGVLGMALVRLFEAAGYMTIPALLLNDRGIHICKSMVAYQCWGNGDTPESVGEKGDHFVAKFYVRFEKENQAAYAVWATEHGFDPDDPPEGKGRNEFFNSSDFELGVATREMLRKFEAGDSDVLSLWEKMNGWVVEGFKKTFTAYGFEFRKWYLESDTCKLGRDIVAKGLKKRLFYKHTDGSIRVDRTKLSFPLRKGDDGTDRELDKVLLRADGTSLYTTQDLGTAQLKESEYGLTQSIYDVAVEQDHHFKYLFAILKMLGYSWADTLYHFSYGMVHLPEGRMKSREGTVVDADNLLADMADEVRKKLAEREDPITGKEADEIAHGVALGAITFYILLATPGKDMTFNPKKSLSFQGDTGPYLQYAVTRIKSILRGVSDVSTDIDYSLLTMPEEQALIRFIAEFPSKISPAAKKYATANIPYYTLGLAKAFTAFYRACPVQKAEPAVQAARVALLKATLQTLTNCLYLMNIPVLDRM